MVSSVFVLRHLEFLPSGLGSFPPFGLSRRQAYLIRRRFVAIALSVGVFSIYCAHGAFQLPSFDVDSLRFLTCDVFRFRKNNTLAISGCLVA